MYKESIRDACIHCTRCTKNCTFLDKYAMDLAAFCERPDLAYHCFLCNRCKEVCPLDLDGQQLSLEHRRENPEKFRKVHFMKTPYKMRNNSKLRSKDVLFTGCNFAGFFPETSKELIRVMATYGVDFSVDCCGKPLYETADQAGADKVKSHLIRTLGRKGCKRIVCACPNCYHYFRGLNDFPFEIITVFQKFTELGIGKIIEEPIDLYMPCPDRAGEEILNDIKPFLTEYRNGFWPVNCCGAGGLAAKKEPDVANGWLKRTEELKKEKLYTYCATCCGRFEMNGVYETHHLISEILGVCERPNTAFAKNALTLKFYDKRRKHHVHNG